MILKPFKGEMTEEPEQGESFSVAAAEILSSAGVTAPLTDKTLDLRSVRKVFDSNGAGLDNVAKTVGQMLRGAETDGGRLKAAELALKVHGTLNELDEKSDMVINININGSQNQTLINLLVPTR